MTRNVFFLSVLAVILGFAAAGTAQTEEAAPAAEAPAPAAPKSAEEILKESQAKWETIKDFHCTMRSFSRKGDVTALKTLELHFKRPHQMRSLVLQGENQGGTVTRDAKGVLKGKKGGALGLVVLTLTEDDERIRNLLGVKFYEADFGTMLNLFSERVAKGFKLERIEPQKVGETECVCIQATNPDPAAKGVTRDVLWIDPASSMIRRRLQFEGQTLVSDSTYNAIELNKDLPDSLFTL